MEYTRATHVAANVGQGMAFLFGFAGLFGNPMLLFIALFVWIGAAQEAAAVEMKTSFADATVRQAMLTDFKTLSPGQTLADAAQPYLLQMAVYAMAAERILEIRPIVEICFLSNRADVYRCTTGELATAWQNVMTEPEVLIAG